MTGVYGKKDKGGGSGTGAVEAPNTLQSQSTARIIEVISHGECVGLAKSDDPLQSVYFDNTPAKNSDGSFNYNGVTLEQRLGTPNQSAFIGFSDVENEVSIGQDITVPFPRTYTVTNNFVDAVRMRILIETLTEQDTKTGDLNGSSVSFQFERRIVGGAWELVFVETLVDKCTSPQQLSYRIDRPTAADDTTDWEVRVTRLTADSTAVTVQNSIQLAAVTEITDSKITYADLAAVAMTIDAKSFGSSVPVRSYDWIGIVLDVPSNYDPPDPLNPLDNTKRTYTGLWDGTFKRAWTDNPAWILWAMLTDPDWGLGKAIDSSVVDKWSLYQIAQYCDEFVNDGAGGLEPRYRVNIQITTQSEAYAMLQSIASVFRGMLFWSISTVSFTADQPKDPIRLFGPANVINGDFTYQGAALKARHSVALVTWNDPTDAFKQTVEVVEDPDMIERFGWRSTSVTAVGCISRGQAHRMGRWILDTEKYESETVTFQVGYDNADLRPGDIISVYDPTYAGARFAGRFKEVYPDHAVLDQGIKLEAGKDYTLVMVRADGTLTERVITNTLDGTVQDTLTWTGDLTDKPLAGTTVTVFMKCRIAGTQRAQVKAVTSSTLTFETAIVLVDGVSYEVDFTLPDGTQSKSTVTTVPSSGTRIGASDQYEHLTISFTPTPTSLPNLGDWLSVSPVGEGQYTSTLSIDADDYGVIMTSSMNFYADYDTYATMTRPDGTTVTRKVNVPSNSTSTAMSWGDPLSPIPIVGGMWGVTVSDNKPRQFRVVGIHEDQKNLWTITALSYDSNKYDRIESEVFLASDGSTTWTSSMIPDAPTNIHASRLPVLQTDGTYTDYIQVGWTPSVDPLVNHYIFSYQYNSGAWVTLSDTVMANVKFVSNGPGTYLFHVTAVSMNGLQSPVAVSSWTLLDTRPFDGATIYNIKVENDTGATTVGSVINFTTPDLSISWQVHPPADYIDQTITNWVDPYLLYYKVDLLDAAGTTTYGTFQTKDERITLTSQQIITAAGGSIRDFKISISMVDAYGDYSPTVQEFTNVAPAAPTTVTLTSGAKSFNVSVSAPTDTDVIGGYVWVATSPGINCATTAPTLDVTNTTLTIPGTSGSTYYVRVAFYDMYSKDPAHLNYSTEQSVTVGYITSGDLTPGIMDDTVSLIASEALAAGDFINVWNNSGTANVRKADASTSGKEAAGFVLASCALGATATVHLSGTNTAVTGVTPGRQFLSTTPGHVSTSVPTGSGQVVQTVGYATSSTSVAFEPGRPVLRA